MPITSETTAGLLPAVAVEMTPSHHLPSTKARHTYSEKSSNVRFEELLEYINPFGKFQLLLYLLVLPASMASYVLTSVFTTQNVPHFCKVPHLWREANSTTTTFANWTLAQKRNFSIPTKSKDEAPAIGQTYQPCLFYDIPYENFNGMSFDEAMELRNRFLRNESESAKAYAKTCRSNEWVYDFSTKDFKDSLQARWNLVCERETLIPISRTVYFLGFFAGLAVGGVASDRLGRRPTVVLSAAATIVTGILTALPLDYTQHLIVQATVAASCNALVTACSVILVEATTARFRPTICFMYMIPFEFSFAYVSLMAWLGQNWRFLQLSINILLLPCLLYPCLLVESPRWLVQRQRTTEATKILRRAARINGRVALPADFDEQVRQIAPQRARKEGEENAALSVGDRIGAWFAHVLQLLRTRQMRVRTFGACSLTFTHELIWFGLTWYAAELEGTNQFVIFSLQGLIALPSMLVAWALYHCYGGRRLMMCFLALSSVCLLSVAAIDVCGAMTRLAVPVLVLATLGKSFNDGSYSSLCIYTLEIFPTQHRNTGFNLSSMVARIASILSPFAKHFANNVWHPLPLLVFGSLSAACFVLLWLVMPDTHNRPLDERADEIEEQK